MNMKTIRTITLFLVVIFMVTLFSRVSAFAWRTIGPEWGGADTTMSLNLGGSWNSEAEDALFRWNSVAGSNFLFWFNNDNHNHCERGWLCIGTDGNAVEWENFSDGECSDPASGALAVTRLNWIIDFCNADVLFNTAYTWTTSNPGWTTGSPYHLNTVAVHEFGHALGLNHENRWLATMNSIYHPFPYAIHADDMDGASYLYPDGTTVVDIGATNWKKEDGDVATAAQLVTSPYSANTGQTISMEVTVENYSTSDRSFNNRLYLSTNDTISSFDTPVATYNGAWIGARWPATWDYSATIPSNTAPGTYWLGICADYDNALAESNEGNNCLAAPHSITISDTTAPTGTISINNGATYTNSTAVTLTLSCSDASSGCYQMRFSNNNATWSAWEANAATKSWTLTSGDGTKTVYVQYRDNSLNVSTSISDTIILWAAYCEPDLIVTGIATTPVAPDPNQNISVTVTVNNQAACAAGAFWIDFYKDLATAPGPYQIGNVSCSKGGLAAGATDTCTGTVSYTAAGSYNMWAQVDTDQTVTESNENNNVFGPQAIKVGFPDLIVTGISTNPVSPGSGQNVSVTVTVQNQGTVAAGSFYIDFYKDLATPPGPYQIGDVACNKGGLAAGATDTCSGTVSYSAAGLYNMWAQVDTDQAVAESIETNNVLGQPVVIGGIPLTQATTASSPIGIDHYEPTNKVVISVNYPTGTPYNFALVAANGTKTQHSSANGLTDEIKVATVRSGPCQGGFAAGELFSGTGVPGVIARISSGGSTVQNPWVTLPGETGIVRGSLFQDRFCSFGGDLIAVTTAGNVWLVTSSGTPTKIANIKTHLEGVTTTPNDSKKYGPWAGKILAGAENDGCVYAIDEKGTSECYKLGISPEDVDIIPAKENFFGIEYSTGTIWGAPASAFTSMVGDVLITQESGALLWHVRWDPIKNSFQSTAIARVTQWEHVTFSPAGIGSISPILPDLTIDSISTSPVVPAPGQNVAVTIKVRNQGSYSGGFYVDFYKNRSTAPGPYTIGDVYCYKGNLAADSTDTCVVSVNYPATGSYSIWAQVDTDQMVAESNESNNVFGPQTLTIQDSTPPTGSILINGGAIYATSTSATLSLSCSDDYSGCYQMRFSNDNATWSAWEANAVSKAWPLTSGDGTKTVYVQYKDNAGNSSGSFSDTIILDATAPAGTISINSGAVSTTSTSVTLTLSCTDAGSGCYQMRFSNDNATWSAWEANAVSKAWTLTSGEGTKTVYVQYRDNAGNASASFFDDILLLPIVSVTLVPDSTSIPRGGTLGYTVTVKNNTSISQTFKYWTYVKLPNGSRYPTTGELFGPVTVTLTAGQTKSAHLSQKIPTTAPLGTYTYYGNVGPYPSLWDSDSFNFTVTTAAPSPEGVAPQDKWELLEDNLTE